MNTMAAGNYLKQNVVRQAGAEGKRLRPTILLLMASTLSAVVPNPHYLTVDERPPNVHPEEVDTPRNTDLPSANSQPVNPVVVQMVTRGG